MDELLQLDVLYDIRCEDCGAAQHFVEAPERPLHPSGWKSVTKQVLSPENKQNAILQHYIIPTLNMSRGKNNKA